MLSRFLVKKKQWHKAWPTSSVNDQDTLSHTMLYFDHCIKMGN